MFSTKKNNAIHPTTLEVGEFLRLLVKFSQVKSPYCRSRETCLTALTLNLAYSPPKVIFTGMQLYTAICPSYSIGY